jgi:hypothetical protein
LGTRLGGKIAVLDQQVLIRTKARIWKKKLFEKIKQKFHDPKIPKKLI